MYLQHLDVSNNRLSGEQTGQAIAKLLLNQNVFNEEGLPLSSLNISQNRLLNAGVEPIFEALLDTRCDLRTLNMTKVEITFLAGIQTNLSENNSLRTALETLILDDNQLRLKSCGRLATLLAISRNIRHIQLRNCSIEDQCITLLCEQMLNHQRIRVLKLEQNRITDLGLSKGIAMMIGH